MNLVFGLWTLVFGVLAPRLRKPREAKKALANVCAAPGRVRLAGGRIQVTLVPVGGDDEQEAFPVLSTELNRVNLVLPGDAKSIREHSPAFASG